MNWPNFISLGRLFAVPVIVWLILSGRMEWAFLTFVMAGLSDILDGLLARALKNRTTVGAYLDPLADKVLLVAVFVTLGLGGYIPLWLVILVAFRDFLIVGGTLLIKLLDYPLTIKPLFISKANTFFQILLVAFILGQTAVHLSLPVLNKVFFIVTACTTILSGTAYVLVWVKQMNQTESE